MDEPNEQQESPPASPEQMEEAHKRFKAMPGTDAQKSAAQLFMVAKKLAAAGEMSPFAEQAMGMAMQAVINALEINDVLLMQIVTSLDEIQAFLAGGTPTGQWTYGGPKH